MSENMNNRPVTANDIAAALNMSVNTIRVYLGDNSCTRKNFNSPSIRRVREYAASVCYDPKAAYAYLKGHRSEVRQHFRETPVITYWYGGNFRTKEEEIQRMKELREAGYTNQEISKKIGRSLTSVWNHLGTQPAAMTEMSHKLANVTRKQKTAARAAYVRNKPIAEYNAKVQEHNELKAKLNALQVELLTEKPQIEQTAKIAVTAPQMNLVNLQPTALN